MPSFADTGRSQAPREELWKLLADSSRLPEWWADNLPDPLHVEPTGPGHRVVIASPLSDLRFEWRLEAEADGTRIDVLVDAPEEDEEFQLEQQRELVRRSLEQLAEVATRAPL
jgi:uncharacterized protein YndB with AHSA1/START domain